MTQISADFISIIIAQHAPYLYKARAKSSGIIAEAMRFAAVPPGPQIRKFARVYGYSMRCARKVSPRLAPLYVRAAQRCNPAGSIRNASHSFARESWNILGFHSVPIDN